MRRQSQFNAKKKFQFAILCVRAMIRIQRLRFTPEPLNIDEALRDPYRVKVLRKVRILLLSYCSLSHSYLFLTSLRSSMHVLSESMVTGSRRVRVKIVLLSLKIHPKLNYTISTFFSCRSKLSSISFLNFFHSSFYEKFVIVEHDLNVFKN